MGILNNGKRAINRALRLVNLRLESLTAERAEKARLRELEREGHFDKPVFPILPQFKACNPSTVFEQIKRDEKRFGEIVKPDKENAFPLTNDYYTTPDAEVMYAIVQMYRPARIVEIGSGYSTQLFRAAIQDAGLNTKLASIDPSPRQEVARFSNEVVKERVEKLKELDILLSLEPNDILFIDSSHKLEAGNDVLMLFLAILPTVRPGVLIHVHDIFLPFEYPKHWLIDLGWDFFKEQYLVQAMLAENPHFEVIWPGHYLQRTVNGFAERFVQWRNVDARSLWLRRA